MTATLTSNPAVTAALLRHGLIAVPAGDGRGARNPDTIEAGIRTLEIDLLDRAALLAAPARAALARLSVPQLRTVGAALIAALDAQRGADVVHRPLFRSFPNRIPADTSALWLARVFSWLLQQPNQPCVLCGTAGTVHPVNPCGDLVCGACFDGGNYDGCPICNQRIDADDPFLTASSVEPDSTRPVSGVLRLLTLTDDVDTSARTILGTLLTRDRDLSGNDDADFTALLDHLLAVGGDLTWVPDRIPGRVTKARLLAALLTDEHARDTGLGLLPQHADTATDLLRVATVLTGGAASLTGTHRAGALARPLRAALLAALDRLEPAQACEDMARHPGRWKVLAEKLHPFTVAARYPNAAVAFAVLRQTNLDNLTPALAGLLRSHARAADVTIRGDRLTVTRTSTRIEAALAAGDTTSALSQLTGRPGELLRRLDHLLRLATAAGPDHVAGVIEAARTAAPSAAPAVLAAARASLTTRTAPAQSRVFFPAGQAAHAWSCEDTRALLPDTVVTAAVSVLTGELLRRAAQLPQVDVAVIDAGLGDVMVPLAARNASRTLVDVPRGSALPLPDGQSLRLFVHWMEQPGQRVDLDLSVAAFDSEWNVLGWCDYTRLRLSGDAAVHSGDLTSAPAPDGATEYVDLNLNALTDLGATYLLPVVFSYNDVAFDDLAAAFAGFTSHAELDGPQFDVRTVQQRFDITGSSRVAIPMVVNLADRSLRWLDLNLTTSGYGHNINDNHDRLGQLARTLTDVFTSGSRPSLGELAQLHAAARTNTVAVIRDLDVHTYTRRAGETTAEFAARLDSADSDALVTDLPALVRGRSVLLALLAGDHFGASGGDGYALYPGQLAGGDVTPVTAADLLGALPAS